MQRGHHIPETVDTSDHTKAVWIKDAFDSLISGRYENVKAIAWWHEDFDETYLRIDSSPESLDAYKKGIIVPLFKERLKFVSGKLVPLKKGIYHGANPGLGGTEDNVSVERIDAFERLAGKKIAWVYFSNNWYRSIMFPKQEIETIHALGKTPFVRLMPRSDFRENEPDPVYSLQEIIEGKFDSALKRWAKEAKRIKVPMLVEFGCEANGDWFPWSGLYNGGERKDGYGDPQKADGPERYRDAYRHIIELFRQVRVDNITWFFHMDAQSTPDVLWNSISAYYPGDDYIDWIGLSVYGAQEKGDAYRSFTEIMDHVYAEILQMTDKPIAIVEFGITEL